MKRFVLLAAATMLFSAPIMAQSQIKVDKEGFAKKIEKSDADIQNPKKNTKSAVWLNRGKIFTDAAMAPSNGLYKGVDEKTMPLMFGKPSSTETKKIGDVDYQASTYENFIAYIRDGKVVFWETTTEVAEDALTKAYDAYVKAIELDAKAAEKAKPGMMQIVSVYKQDAENSFLKQDYKAAADAFKKAYDIEANPAVNIPDTAALFNAGFLYTIASEFQNGAECLKTALDKYNYANDGDTYYYLFHCYFGLKDNEAARAILMDGLGKYPKNNKIVEGLLQLYSNGGGDPQEIIPIVEKAVNDDPNNPDLWGGLGRIYEKLYEYYKEAGENDQAMGELDKSVAAFEKAAELAKNDFSAQFNLGLLQIKKGDELNQILNKSNITSQEEYNASLGKVNAVYALSVAPLEAALALQPNDPATIELLKNVCFRLRDEAGMMDKYNKYNDMFKNLQGQ